MLRKSEASRLIVRAKRTALFLSLSAALAACGGGSGDGVVDSVSLTQDSSVDAGTNNPVTLPSGNSTSDQGTTNPPGQDTTADPGSTPAGAPADPVAAIEQAFRLTDVGMQNRTYFVATNGSDGNSGLSLEAPFRTIEQALGLAGPGDTIEIRGGSYTPAGNGFALSRAGNKDAWIKMKAHNGERVVLNAKGYAIYVNAGAQYWILEGLEMSGGTDYTIKIDAPNVRVIRNKMYGSSNDIMKLVNTSDDVVILGNEIHSPRASNGANAQGIDIVGADRTWVAHNYVHDIPSIGIYAKGNSRNTVFENNRVENVYARGIMLGQATGPEFMYDGRYETYDGIIRNNIIVNAREACLATASSYNVKIYNNSCYNAAWGAHGAIFVSTESLLGQAGTKIDIRNNIIVGTSRPVLKIGPGALTSDDTLTVDRNLYYNNGQAATFQWEDRGIWNVPLSQWRASTGKDLTSIEANPKYTDIRSLTIASDSPAIDTGIDTTLVGDDYKRARRPQGGGTDIGAYEAR